MLAKSQCWHNVGTTLYFNHTLPHFLRVSGLNPREEGSMRQSRAITGYRGCQSGFHGAGHRRGELVGRVRGCETKHRCTAYPVQPRHRCTVDCTRTSHPSHRCTATCTRTSHPSHRCTATCTGTSHPRNRCTVDI